MSQNCIVSNKTRNVLPFVPFEAIKNEVLGEKYSLSVAIVNPGEIQKLNLTYRNINKPTDILSFPLSKTEGEIYICISETKKEAVKFDRSYENFLAFIFIHGCVHLKGYDHGGTMEDIETKVRNKFKV
jgi:probable rRNA maturation factor